MKRIIALAALAALFQSVCAFASTPIRNDVFKYTAEGTPIYSQGGGIFRFTDPQTGKPAYYWYGAWYAEAEQYLQDPSVTLSGNRMKGVSCYKSTDLVNWTDVGPVLTAEEVGGGRPRVGWFGRLGVTYVKEAGKYALLAQHNNSVMVALSDSPTGPFKIQNRIDMTSTIGTPNTGDQTVFYDEDTQTGYLIYSYGQGRAKGYVSEIGVLEDGTIGLKNCVQIFRGEGREGNCMFKYKGKYYFCASNLYGWDSSFAYYLVADDIYGPYEPLNKMEVMDGCEKDYAHITQTGFFYTVRGTKEETVIYCGDRWADFAGNGLGYNQWVPLSFNGSCPYFNSLSEWTLDAKTGVWKVGAGNNYVLNGSFEADRKAIPSPTKPLQEFLRGWDTEIIKGNAVSASSKASPQLNYMNTREDRQQVIGEKSLQISDRVDFERKVSQIVESTPFVELKDGTYTLRFKFRNSGNFETLTVSLGNETQDLTSLKSDDKWTETELKAKVRGGKVTVSFHAKGSAGARCLIDDVTLVRSR